MDPMGEISLGYLTSIAKIRAIIASITSAAMIRAVKGGCERSAALGNFTTWRLSFLTEGCREGLGVISNIYPIG